MANTYEKLFSEPKYGEKQQLDDLIKKAFDQQGQTELATPADIKKTEEYLTAIFYNTGEGVNADTQKIHKDLIEWATKALSNFFQQTINDFDFSQGKVSSTPNELASKFKITVDQYTSFLHTTKIAIQTIQSRADAVAKKLNDIKNLSKLPPGVSELEKIYNELQDICDELIKIMPTSQSTNKNGIHFDWIEIGDNEDLRKKIERFDTLSRAVTLLSDTVIPPYILGPLFEIPLQMIYSYGVDLGVELAKSEIGRTLGKFSNVKTSGATSANRGRLNSGSVSLGIDNIKFDIEETKEKSKSGYNYEFTYNNFTIKVNGTFASRQGKADIIINIPNSNQRRLGISAKNWSSMISGKHDFGDTTLFDALLRDIENLNSYINFGLQLGYATRYGDKPIAKYSQYVDCMHLYARLCLLLDILIGYSQKEAYADTIIINDRNRKRIKVYNIRDILMRIKDKYEKLIDYTNYKPKDIEDAIRNKHIEFSKELSNQDFAQLLKEALQQYRYKVLDKVILDNTPIT